MSRARLCTPPDHPNIPKQSRRSVTFRNPGWTARRRGHRVSSKFRTRLHSLSPSLTVSQSRFCWPVARSLTIRASGESPEDSDTGDDGNVLTHQIDHRALDNAGQPARCPPRLQPRRGRVSWCARTRSWTWQPGPDMSESTPVTVASDECEVSFVCLVLADARVWKADNARTWLLQAKTRLKQGKDGDWRVSWRRGGRRNYRRFSGRKLAAQCLEELCQLCGSSLHRPQANASLRRGGCEVQYQPGMVFKVVEAGGRGMNHW